MTLKELIEKRNLDGRIYRGALREWLGVDIEKHKFEELIERLSEIKEL